MIEVKNLHFSYDQTPILQDISLTIEKGAFVGIVGPNGSGKTTLLKLMAGLLKGFQGNILLEGMDIHHWTRKQIALHISMVPQDTIIPFSFTALEIVLMGRSPHLKTFAFETQKDVAIALEAMSLTGVHDLAHRSIEELSGGEKQRVILARALAQQSPILLLDEPTSHLDIKHQIDIHNLVKKLNKEKGITIINILHDLNLTSHYCEEVIMLKNGRVCHRGPPHQVMTQETIQEVFDTPVQVGHNKKTGQPYYLPVD